jgi:hypothetical protein
VKKADDLFPTVAWTQYPPFLEEGTDAQLEPLQDSTTPFTVKVPGETKFPQLPPWSGDDV